MRFYFTKLSDSFDSCFTWLSRIIFLAGLPILAQRQIKHGIIRIARHLLLNHQKRRQTLQQHLIIQCRVRLQQYQTLATRMCRLTINIQLKILIIHEETTSFLVDGEVWTVFLGEHVDVVTMGDLGFYFYYLTSVTVLTANSMHVTEVTWK